MFSAKSVGYTVDWVDLEGGGTKQQRRKIYLRLDAFSDRKQRRRMIAAY